MVKVQPYMQDNIMVLSMVKVLEDKECLCHSNKDSRLNKLPLWVIERYILEFILYAEKQPELTFELTRIGCGLAGYTDKEIAPMFKYAPTNVLKPTGW